jgi:hypothetical protein
VQHPQHQWQQHQAVPPWQAGASIPQAAPGGKPQRLSKRDWLIKCGLSVATKSGVGLLVAPLLAGTGGAAAVAGPAVLANAAGPGVAPGFLAGAVPGGLAGAGIAAPVNLADGPLAPENMAEMAMYPGWEPPAALPRGGPPAEDWGAGPGYEEEHDGVSLVGGFVGAIKDTVKETLYSVLGA